MSHSVCVFGATSAIGRAMARSHAQAGHELVLAARNVEEAGRLAQDLTIRFNVACSVVAFDAEKHAADLPWFKKLIDTPTSSIEGFVFCHGLMFEEAVARREPEVAARMMSVNYVSTALLLERAAVHLESAGRGWICVVTSVAGDRGRASNYLYGSSKAALQTLLSGLRVRLSRSGVSVTDVRPGFVDTAMTYGLPGLFLVASPDRVARDTFRSIQKGRSIVYSPFFWRWIMLIIRWLPEGVFKRLPL